jgi:hypothetical protein
MAMKSSYDLAMEKLAARLPPTGRKLNKQEKARLANFDSIYKAKIAECELELKPKIAAALARGDAEAAQKLEETLRAGTARLRAKLEDEKEKIRQGK